MITSFTFDYLEQIKPHRFPNVNLSIVYFVKSACVNLARDLQSGSQAHLCQSTGGWPSDILSLEDLNESLLNLRSDVMQYLLDLLKPEKVLPYDDHSISKPDI